MNFYKHFLGDYVRDTAHLSLIEHGAYRVLLDTYYATGRPLPAAKDALYRIAKAFSAAERKAVDAVAKQYFPVNGDGFRHNHRADAELTKYSTQAETNRLIAVARERKRKEHEQSTNRATNLESRSAEPNDFLLDSEQKDLLSEMGEKTVKCLNSNEPDSTNRATNRQPNHSQKPEKILNSKSKTLAASDKKISLSADGVWQSISAEQLALWQRAYPALSLDRELAKAAAWIIANPAHKKSNYARFLNGWLRRSQDNAPIIESANRMGKFVI